MEKPPDERNRRRYRSLDEDTPEIIITDADPRALTTPPEVPAVVEPVVEADRQEQGVFKEQYESGKRSGAQIVKHAVMFALVLGLGILLHQWLILLGNPKIFDLIPWTFASDGADLTILVKLVIIIWKELGNEGKSNG